MEKDYRLIQIIESRDNITREKILIFEMALVEYNFNRTGYNFIPNPSVNNHFFVYPNKSDIENYYLSEPEEIKTIDINDFNDYLIETPEGVRKTFYIKEFDERRKKIKFNQI